MARHRPILAAYYYCYLLYRLSSDNATREIIKSAVFWIAPLLNSMYFHYAGVFQYEPQKLIKLAGKTVSGINPFA